MQNNAPLLVLNLPLLIQRLNKRNTGDQEKLSAIILLKRPEKQIVLAAFREGTTMKSYQSNDSMTFQVIQGQLIFQTRKKSMILRNGQFLQLYDKIKYSITTNEETVFLITYLNGELLPN